VSDEFQSHSFDAKAATLDPFYTYLGLTEQFGEGQVFLLDAANETGTGYRMSLIGVLPILEFQVKDGDIAVFAVTGLAEYLRHALAAAGWREVCESDAGRMKSYVDGPCLRYRSTDPMSVLECIRQAIRANHPVDAGPPFSTGLFGYIGYDAVHYLEALPKTTLDDRGLPDVRLQWYAAVAHLNDDGASVYDALPFLEPVLSDNEWERWARQVEAVRYAMVEARVQGTPPRQTPHVDAMASAVEDVSRERFIANVEAAREYIRAGDIFQVVLSKRLRVPKRMHHYTVYEKLRAVNPSPYMFMAEYPDMRLFGASPEVQFRAVGGVAEMKPIAGTSKGRGRSVAEDEALIKRLLSDEKERAEHVMLVDLCRNDLGRVCEYGSVTVDEFLTVEAYSHLFHLVSRVTGVLRNDVSVFHALLATFPAGTLSGAPKIRAMEIIDELEPYRRGPYGGMVGIIDFDGNANTAIVIRTVVEHQGTYYVQAGAGIVADSNPEQEWQECNRKLGALLEVLGVPRLESVR
jgi:anthranilate synthase component I